MNWASVRKSLVRLGWLKDPPPPVAPDPKRVMEMSLRARQDFDDIMKQLERGVKRRS